MRELQHGRKSRRLLGLGLALLTVAGAGLTATEASARSWLITYRGDGTSDPKVDITFDVLVIDRHNENFAAEVQDIDADHVEMTGCPNQSDRGMNLTFELVEPVKFKDDGDFRGSYSANGLSQSFSGGVTKGDEDDLGLDPLRKLGRIKGIFKYGAQGPDYNCRTGRVDWKARAVRREDYNPGGSGRQARERPSAAGALPFFDLF